MWREILSDYEPGSRAGSVTGTNSVVFIWEISARPTGMNSRNTTKMVEHKFVLFATFKAFWTLVTCFTNKADWHTSKVEIHTRSKLCHFVGRYVVRAKLFCLKSFVPVTGLECSYGKIFIPVTEISDLGNRASPASHINTSIFLQTKERRDEISETEPARLTGLI